MIEQKMNEAFNKQINAELYSSYLYLSMAACFESKNLSGFATWLKMQAEEERGHALKFFEHINERGGRVELTSIDQPPADWDTALKAFEDVLAHEKKVTAMINDLMDMAKSDSDHASQAFLNWFVSEQVEEEANADDILQKLSMVGDSANGLMMLDQALAKRGAAE
mgnify:CR=1 FL=1